MRPKYGNERTSGFASKQEKALYDQLWWRERAGEISDLKCQDYVYLTRARILYIADFTFKNQEGIQEWAEQKGFETDVWRIKRRLWIAYGPGRLTIYKGIVPRPVETLEPKTGESELA